MNALSNEQLSDYEIEILACMMRNRYSSGPNGSILKGDIDQDLRGIDFTDHFKISMALTSLKKMEMVEQHPENDRLFLLSDKGVNWLFENKNNLKLKSRSE